MRTVLPIDGWIRTRFPSPSGTLLLTLLLTLALAVLCAGRADAEPRIKVSCEVYNTNKVDPIAFSAHLHHQFGNTSTTNASTGRSLFANARTSCKQAWFTSAGWFPVEASEPVRRVAVYYRAPGNPTTIRPIPTGLQLIAHEQMYNCNGGSFRATPPYGCRGNWNTRLIFPDCWNQASLQENTTVYSRNGVCPRSHPYRIPVINYLIQHDNADRRVSSPLLVSSGAGTWANYAFMHGDYLAANQPIFNTLLDTCLRNAGARGNSRAGCG